MIGHLPGVVLVPTIHVQLTRRPIVRFGYRPCACDGPLLYRTVIEHVAFLETRTDKVAYEPGEAGEVTLVSRTLADAAVGNAMDALRSTRTSAS